MNGKPQTDARLRLDELLTRRGLFASRSRARDAIERATVRVAGAIATKPGLSVGPEAVIEVDDPARAYVSRAALKLITGLDAFGINPAGHVGLDIGASTGGFTQVLLDRGAARVIAIDVGHGQLAKSLAGDSRVELHEGLNARDLTAAHLGEAVPSVVVCDVSFISLRLALPAALSLAGPGAHGVFLVKPQFEAGREAIGKGGILKNRASGRKIADDIAGWLVGRGWMPLGITPSPIEGGDGNREFLLGAVKAP